MEWATRRTLSSGCETTLADHPRDGVSAFPEWSPLW